MCKCLKSKKRWKTVQIQFLHGQAGSKQCRRNWDSSPPAPPQAEGLKPDFPRVGERQHSRLGSTSPFLSPSKGGPERGEGGENRVSTRTQKWCKSFQMVPGRDSASS